MTNSESDQSVKIVNFSPRDDVSIRLFVFSHAGGSATAYRDWAPQLPATVEVMAISLPGRGSTLHLPAIAEWKKLVTQAANAIEPYLDGTPFSLFGHSFGALFAYEVVRELLRRKLPPPACLFVSAHGAPQLQSARQARIPATHQLSDAAFLDAAKRWGFLEEALLADPDLVKVMLPALRADLTLDETYHFDPVAAEIPLPLVVYGGSSDDSVAHEELSAWHELATDAQTRSKCRTRMFDGGHFYSITHQAEVLRDIQETLEQLLDEFPLSVIRTQQGKHSHAEASGSAGALVHEMFDAQVKKNPDSVAIVDGDTVLTYREVGERADLLARALQQSGLRAGDITGILLPHCASYAIAMLAILKAGGAVALLETNWSPAFLEEFVEASSIAIIVTDPILAAVFEQSLESEGVQHFIFSSNGLDELEQTAGSLPPLVAADRLPSDVAMVSMTSGSTGKPKAVLTTHRGCAFCFEARFSLYPYLDNEREAVNVFFAWECLRPLLQGIPLYVIPDDVIFDPPRLIRYLDEHRITRLITTPSLLEQTVQHPSTGRTLGERLSSLKYWFLTGEVVHRHLVEKAAEALPGSVELVNMYSTWECLDVSYANLLSGPPAGRRPALAYPGSLLGLAGKVIPGVDLYVLDDALHPVPQGVAGYVYVAGPGVAAGYLNDDDKTRERFISIPARLASTRSGETAPVMYFTGDRGRIHRDGQVELLGRADATVKLRGFKVSLHQVEHGIAQLESVKTCAVLPVKDDASRQSIGLVAYVVGTNGKPSDDALSAMRNEVKALLPHYAVPAYWVGLDELPLRKGESRKLDIHALPKPGIVRAAPVGTRGDHFDAIGKIDRTVINTWKQILNSEDASLQDNFFDVGGNSLLAAALAGELSTRYGLKVNVIDLYQHSTLAGLIEFCGGGKREKGISLPESPSLDRQRDTAPSGQLAIVGMACRLPGAKNIDEFWQNLTSGRDSLRTFSRDELASRGVPDEVLDHPQWVPVGQVVDDADKFDAYFWGIGAHEATLMDPQQRVFLETAWTAMEHAGYAPRSNQYRQRIGVFAACGIDGYLVHHLNGGGLKTPLDPGRLMLTEIGNEKDYIATRVAYQLDLGGPAMTVTSACSSALVAVAQAAQSILTGQCDMAIAGGASLTFPNFGYCYTDGLVGSKDGRVRPLDDGASGTLFGDGIGAVVLKRREDAEADGDTIWALLTGVGVTNDGRQKAGYTAPNAVAQRNCITTAMNMAGVRAEQMSYVECHATATHVGDAIELQGLTEAYSLAQGESANYAQSIAIGSVKGNIGHANCAAGITGLIKTALMLKHRTLVPTVHFETLNPKLHPYVGGSTPFFVHQGTGTWNVANPDLQFPRRAGVSSFGIGGTNAHAVLEEWTVTRPAEPAGGNSETTESFQRQWHLLTLSAKTRSALLENVRQLRGYLTQQKEEIDAGNAAYTLHVGREVFPYRATALARDGMHAAEQLQDLIGRLSQTEQLLPKTTSTNASVVFCFSGQGSQYPAMARGLYLSPDLPVFRQQFDKVCDLFLPLLGFNPREAVFSNELELFNRPTVIQPGLFALEYALAQALMGFGIQPTAVAGHSIGEYVAAVIAGVLTLSDAIKLVAVRSAATEEIVENTNEGPGAMLSANLSEEVARALITDRADVWIGVCNAPDTTVFSGSLAAIESLHHALREQSIRCARLHVTHAFHSGLMRPVADAINACMRSITMNMPVIPMTSNVSGGWFDEDMLRPTYWGEHMAGTVKWVDNAASLLQWKPDAILEIGPGNTLCNLVEKSRRALRENNAAASDLEYRPQLISFIRGASVDDADDGQVFTDALGRCWAAGISIDWNAYHKHEVTRTGAPLQRIPLPAYCFDKTSFWLNPENSIYVDIKQEPPYREMPNQRHVGAWRSDQAASMRLVRYGVENKADASVVLYCFPFAGGSSRNFEKWARLAPSWLDVVAVELPGRNGRGGERVNASDKEDALELAEIGKAIILDAQGKALSLCGMSYGALLATELAFGPLRDALLRGQIMNLHVVGRDAVNIDGLADDDHPAEMNIEEFIVAPPEVRKSREWEEYFLPLLKGDLNGDARAASRIKKHWRDDAAENSKIRINGIHVHYGDVDRSFDPLSIQAWYRLVGADTGSAHRYTGGHDFMLNCGGEIFLHIVESLIPLAYPPAPPSTCQSQAGTRTERASIFTNAWTRLPSQGAGTNVNEVSSVLRLSDARVPLDADDFEAMSTSDGLWIVVERREVFESAFETAQCAAFIDLARQCSEANATGRIVLVMPASAQGALIAGASKAISHEYPDLRFARLFLETEIHQAVSGLMDEGRQIEIVRSCLTTSEHAAENDMWCRRERDGIAVYGQRLLPLQYADPGAQLPGWTRGEGAFLISGGTGGIGGALIDWLVDVKQVSPQRIVLLSRNPQVHPRGVTVIPVDICDPDALRRNSQLQLIRTVAGVFHLAGSLDDGVALNMSAERLEKVVAPKASIFNLMQLAVERKWPLQWITAFSSTSSLFGYPGQSNYCAANAILDHLAIWQDATLPVLTVNWGPWAEAGMSKQGTKAFSKSLAEGDIPMKTQDALDGLDRVLNAFHNDLPHPGHHFTICNTRWEQSLWRQHPMLSRIPADVERRHDSRRIEADVSMDETTAASTRSRGSMGSNETHDGATSDVRTFLSGFVSAWSPHDDLTSLGLDSLDLVQIRNGFNRTFNADVPLSTFFAPNMTLENLERTLATSVPGSKNNKQGK
ncbi:alpha/beta fold hydrolase [Noviherbaspirillum sp. ST9]|uniref:alpha/beta fold hydrolase n=1 Tax=Noviherbaspirillum sp. ST9 TaxID=3401606 RepID=UPI003B585DAE